MKIKYAILLLTLVAGFAQAQTTAITATITDIPDAQTWNNATFSGMVVSPNGPPTISGVRVAASSLIASGTLSNSGVMTVTVARTSSFDQSSACWQFTIVPNASAPGYTTACVATTSSSMTLSTQLSAGANSPRFFAGPNSFGYADSEVLQPILYGSTYINVSTISAPTLKQYNLSGWVSISGGGGGAVSSVFGRTGAVVATSGDYSVGQVTGAAPTASPTFTGVVQMTSATVFTLPEFASTPPVTSNFGYNTTRGQYEGYNGSVWVFPWVAVGGGTAAQCAYWISAYNLGSQACSTPSLAFPLTVSGTTTSGGVPYFSNTTTLTSSGILNTNILVKGGGAGGAPTNSLFTDNGTTATYTGTGGVTAPVFTGSGTTPGASSLVAGSGSIPALTANSAGFAAPATGGTAYLIKLPATATAGIPLWATPATGDGVNETALTIVPVIANTTTTVGTTAIAANTCASTVTVTMTGVASTSTFTFTPNADVSTLTGWGSTGGLVIIPWPTTNTLNYHVCNQTGSSITPGGSVTFNVTAFTRGS